jgi:hypothetical protein
MFIILKNIVQASAESVFGALLKSGEVSIPQPSPRTQLKFL